MMAAQSTSSRLRCESQELVGVRLPHHVSYNRSGTRMAAASVEGVHIYDQAAPEASWSLAATLQAPGGQGEVAQVEWAHPEHGNLVAAVAPAAGRVFVWEEKRPAAVASASEPAAGWELAAVLGDVASPLETVAFAPGAQGLWLALAARDGSVRLYECLGSLEATPWELQSCFAVMGDIVPRALAWGPQTSGPPLLAVACQSLTGSSQTAGVQLWAYSDTHAQWGLAGGVSHPPGIAELTWSAIPIAGGRLLAGAHAGDVYLWRVGDVSADVVGGFTVAVEEITVLAHQGEVCQMEWNLTASTLATSTADGNVSLWSSNLATGEWQVQAVVAPQTS